MKMKKISRLLLLVFCLLFSAAAAAPSITDGKTTGWIGENGIVNLQDASGILYQIPAAVIDLPGITDEALICVTKAGQMITLSLDGAQIHTADDAAVEAANRPRFTLKDGALSFQDESISSTACVAAEDGSFLYFVERSQTGWILRVHSELSNAGSAVPGTREAFALALAGKAVSEPLNLSVTGEALTLTDVNHGIFVYDLRNGAHWELPSSDDATAAACVMNGTLYRYSYSEENGWMLASAETLPVSVPTETPVPTFTPAPTATPPPTPTSTPSPKPTATPQNFIDEDGTIHKGASGDEVRKIQRRLDALGYPVGSADGRYGDKTQLAINLFCDAIHVREHNYITPSVQKKLFASSAPEYDPYLPLEKGDRGVSVLYMQRRLKELGYDPQKLDGIYGDMTVQALSLFQSDYRIKLGPGEKPGETASHDLLEILFAPESDMVPVKK